VAPTAELRASINPFTPHRIQSSCSCAGLPTGRVATGCNAAMICQTSSWTADVPSKNCRVAALITTQMHLPESLEPPGKTPLPLLQVVSPIAVLGIKSDKWSHSHSWNGENLENSQSGDFVWLRHLAVPIISHHDFVMLSVRVISIVTCLLITMVTVF